MGAVSGASYPKVDAERLLTGAGALRRTAVLVDEAGVEVERHATALPTSLPGAGREMARTLADVGESTRRGAASLREGAGALEEQAGQVDYAQRSMELTAAVTLWTVAQLVWAMATTAGASAALVPGVLAGGRRSVGEILAEFFRLVCSGAVFGAGQDALVQASQLGEYRRGLDVTSLLVAGVGGLAGGLGDPAGHALGGRMGGPALLRKAVGGALGGAIGGEAGAVVSTAWQGGEWDPAVFGLAAAAGAGTGVIGGALHHYTQLKHVRNPRLSQDPVGVRGTDHWTAPAAHDRQPAAELPPPALTGTPEPVSHEATAPAPRESGVARPEAGRAIVERLGHVEAAVSSTASDARPGGPDPVGAERDVSTTPTRPAPTTTGEHPAYEHAVRTADTPVRPLEPLYDRRDWRSREANWLEAVDKAQENPLVCEVQDIAPARLHTWWNALPELHRRQLNAELNVLVAPADRPAPAARIPEPAAVVRLRAAFAGELATHRLTDPHTTTDQILDRTPGHPTNHPATPDDHSRQTFLHAAGLQATAADRRAGILPGGARTKKSTLAERRAAAEAGSSALKRPLVSPSGSDPQPQGAAGKRPRAASPTMSVHEGTPVTVPTDEVAVTALIGLARELKDRGVFTVRNGTLKQLAHYILQGPDEAPLRAAARTILALRPGEPLTTAGLQLGHTLDRFLTDPAHTTAPWKANAFEYAGFLNRHHLPLDTDHLDTLHILHGLTRAPGTTTGTTTTARLDHLVTTVNPAVSTPSKVDRLRLITDALALRRENRPVTVDALVHADDQRLAHAMEWTPTTPDHGPHATTGGVGGEAVRFAIALMKERGDLPFTDGVPEAEDPTVRSIAAHYTAAYTIMASTAAAEAAATTQAQEIATPHRTHGGAVGTADDGEEPAVLEDTATGPVPFRPRVVLPEDATVRAAYEELLAVLHEENRRDQIPRQLRDHAATLDPAPRDSVYRGWNPENEETNFNAHYKAVKGIAENVKLLMSSRKDDYWARRTAAACLLADNGAQPTVIRKRLAVTGTLVPDLVKHAPSQHPWTPEELGHLVRDWIHRHQDSTTLLAHLQANTPYAPIPNKTGQLDYHKFAHPVFVDAEEQLQTTTPKPSRPVIAAKLGVNADTLAIWKREPADGRNEPAVVEDTSMNPVPFRPRLILPEDPGVREAYNELLAVLHQENRRRQIPPQLRAYAATLGPAPRGSVYHGWNPNDGGAPTFKSHYKKVKNVHAKANLLKAGRPDEFNLKLTAAACLMADNGTQKQVSLKRLDIAPNTLTAMVKHAPSQHPWTPEEAGRLVRDWSDNHQDTTLVAHLQANTPYAPVARDGRIDHAPFARPVFVHGDARLRTTSPGLDQAGRARKLGVDVGTLARWVAGAAADGEGRAAAEVPARAPDAADGHGTPAPRTDGGTAETPGATDPTDRVEAGRTDSRPESPDTDHTVPEGRGFTDPSTVEPMAVDGAEDGDAGASTARSAGSGHHLPTEPGHEIPAPDSPDPVPFRPRVVLPKDPGVRAAYEELLAVLHEENRRDQIPRRLRDHAATLDPAPYDSVFRGWNPKNERPNFQTHYKTAKWNDATASLLKTGLPDEFNLKLTAAACLMADNGTLRDVSAKHLGIAPINLSGLVTHAPSRHPWTAEEAAHLVRDWIAHHQDTTLVAHLQANTPYAPVTNKKGNLEHPAFARPVLLHADAQLRSAGRKLNRKESAGRIGVPVGTLRTWEDAATGGGEDRAAPERAGKTGPPVGDRTLTTAPHTASAPTAETEAIRPGAATEPTAVDGAEGVDAGPTVPDHEIPTPDSLDPAPFEPRLVLPEDATVRAAYNELLAVLHQENHSDQIPPRLRHHAAALAPARPDSVYRGWNPQNQRPSFNAHYKTAKGIDTKTNVLKSIHKDDYRAMAAAAACLLADNGTHTSVIETRLAVHATLVPDLVAHAPSRHPWTPEEAGRLVRDWIDHHQDSTTLLAHLRANTPYAPVPDTKGGIEHPAFARPVFLHADAQLQNAADELSRAERAIKLGVLVRTLYDWEHSATDGGEDRVARSGESAPGARPGRRPRADAAVGAGVTPALPSAQQRIGARKEPKPATVQGGTPRTPWSVKGSVPRRTGAAGGGGSGASLVAKALRGSQASVAVVPRGAAALRGARVTGGSVSPGAVSVPGASGAGAATGARSGAPGPRAASVFCVTPPPARTADRITGAPPRDAVGLATVTDALPGRLALPAGGTHGTLAVITPTVPGGETATTGHGRSSEDGTVPFGDPDVYLPDVAELFGDEGYGLRPLDLGSEGIPGAGTEEDTTTTATHDPRDTRTDSIGTGIAELLASTSLSDAIDSSRPTSPAGTTDTRAEVAETPEEHAAESSSPVLPPEPGVWDALILDDPFPGTEALGTLTAPAEPGGGEDVPGITDEDLEEMDRLISAYPVPAPAPALPAAVVESAEPPAVLEATPVGSGTGFATKVTIPEGGFSLEEAPSPLYCPTPPAHAEAEPVDATDATAAAMDVDSERETATPSPSASTDPAPAIGAAPDTPVPYADLYDPASFLDPEFLSDVPTIAGLADTGLDRVIGLDDDFDAEWRGWQTEDTDLAEGGTGFAANVVVPGITRPFDATDTPDTEMTDAAPYPPYTGTPPPAPGTPTTTSPRAMALPLTSLPDL